MVNTHANGDHCYGNQLVAGADIVASTASAREMDEVPPSMLAGLMRATDGLGDAGAYLRDIFGPFTFDGIEPVPPTTTFDGELDLLRRRSRRSGCSSSGRRTPAAMSSSTCPTPTCCSPATSCSTAATRSCGPGPVTHWIEACDRMLALGATTVVPGHGPLSDRACIEDQRGYLEWLVAEGTPRLEGGMAPLDAARDMAGGPYDGWGERERLVVNLTALSRDLGQEPAADVLTLFGGMATLAKERAG